MESKTIEYKRLSTGRLMVITKLGRKYSLMVCGLESIEPPEITRNLNLSTAYRLFNDNLAADVCETN